MEKLKIGTITFHWATNYGAVLQAYALQTFLKSNSIDTEIIDYIPQDRERRLHNYRKNDLLSYTKENNLEIFRRNHLLLSDHSFSNSKQLHNSDYSYDCVITGSDQVWNQSFICYAEGHFHFKPVLSYYLDFLPENVRKIAFAVSFGTEQLKTKVEKYTLPELQQFKAIGVRENSGKELLKRIGVSSEVVLDPTFLLDPKYYIELIGTEHTEPLDNHIFSYILHGDELARNVSDMVTNKLSCDVRYDDGCTLQQWLRNIKTSAFVVTNSFHGMALSIILHKEFIVNVIKGSNMNDRIYTLLEKIGLSDRIVDNCSDEQITHIINTHVDWKYVDNRIAQLQSQSRDFLLSNIF